MSILSVGALAILNPVAQFQKANDARRKSDLFQIQKALELYYNDNAEYPPINGVEDYRIKGLYGNVDDRNVVSWGSSWEPYMDILPKDPSSSKRYVYFTDSGRQLYFLYASLDRGTDPSACSAGNCSSLSKNGISTAACGGTCNFAVTSPNVSP